MVILIFNIEIAKQYSPLKSIPGCYIIELQKHQQV